MTLTATQVDEQRKQAEELLFSEKHALGFAKGLFLGQFQSSLLFPYPQLTAEQSRLADQTLAEVRKYCAEHIDAAAIDREAIIPPEVVAGLGKLGVLGMTAPTEVGGRAFTQQMYVKIMEVIGGHCARAAVFVNAAFLHRHPGGSFCSATPEQQKAVARPTRQRRKAGSVCPDRARGRLRREQRPDDGDADARRQGVRPQRDQEMDHERRHRRRAPP